jgi:ACS family pantothenate transporter-like MFS transporter
VGKYAPDFKMGFSIMCGVSVLQFSSIFLVKFVSERYDTLKHSEEEDDEPRVSAAEDADKPPVELR